VTYFRLCEKATGRWKQIETRGRRPVGRAGHSATLLNNKLYIFGGYNSIDGTSFFYLNDLHILDVESMEWIDVTIPPLGTPPEPMSSHSACVLNSKVYYFGGTRQWHFVTHIQTLDTSISLKKLCFLNLAHNCPQLQQHRHRQSLSTTVSEQTQLPGDLVVEYKHFLTKYKQSSRR
jgi:hypothetical protein